MSGAWRPVRMSSALVYPVTSRWRLAQGHGPTAWLSAQQRAVLIYVAWRWKRHGRLAVRLTLEEMTKTLGMTSRGQLQEELARLKQLNLIGFKSYLGSKGCHYLWLDRRSARLRAVRQVKARTANARTSNPFRRFLSVQGLESAAQRSGSPLLAGLPAARDGPRRGSEPAHQVYERCPTGHRIRLERRSWIRLPGGGFKTTWRGACRRCGGRLIEITRELAAAPREPRPLTSSELADPELRERRRRLAIEAIADPVTPWTVRQQLRRDYLDRDDGSATADSVAAPRGEEKR